MNRHTRMAKPPTGDSKRRLMECLKRGGPATAGALARMLGITAVAARQHLWALEQRGWVAQRPCPPAGRGRPAAVWSLTDRAGALFPDRHGELTVGLIGAMRRAIGEAGLDRVIDVRAHEQIRAYRSRLPPTTAPLGRRVRALAAIRTREGYMAEVVREGRGRYLLIEHHCPICEAARSCTGLCRAELTVFREALGEGVHVERVEHVPGGDARCAYRVTVADSAR